MGPGRAISGFESPFGFPTAPHSFAGTPISLLSWDLDEQSHLPGAVSCGGREWRAETTRSAPGLSRIAPRPDAGNQMGVCRPGTGSLGATRQKGPHLGHPSPRTESTREAEPLPLGVSTPRAACRSRVPGALVTLLPLCPPAGEQRTKAGCSCPGSTPGDLGPYQSLGRMCSPLSTPALSHPPHAHGPSGVPACTDPG